MRVLLLGPYPPPHGGVQTHLVSIREHLLRRKVPCAVVNITRHRSAEHDEIYYPKNARELVGLLFKLDYDVLHLHFGGDLSMRLVALAFICTLVPRVRTILTFHSGGYPSSPVGRAASYWSTRGFVLRRLDRLIGVNEELGDMFRRFGVPDDRVKVIQPHAFVETSPAAASSQTLPPPLNSFFETHSPVLLTVGGLETEYEIPLQIDMLAVLRRTMPNAGLAIIGGGSLESEIRSRIDASPHREHLLLCGDVPHTSTLNAIGRSDLLLRPTLYDGDSIAVREALHVGTPVIATDNNMRPKGVRLISKPTAETLAAAAMDCLANPEPRGDLEENSDANLEAVLAVYRQLSPLSGRNLSSRTTLAG